MFGFGSPRGPAEMRVEMAMGAKDVIRALLDRLPDDCKLDDVVEQIMLLDGPWIEESDLPPLTEAQRAALEESIEHHRRHPERALRWREVLGKTEPTE